jgi:hypothetical protein
MKRLWLLTGFLLVLMAGMTSRLKADDNCYLCNTTPWQLASRTIYLPAYPNCPINVSYLWRKCPNGITEVSESGWSFDPSVPGCSGFENDLYPNGTHNFPDWNFAKMITEDAIRQTIQQTFIDAYTAALPWEKKQFECDSSKITYRAIQAGCTGYYEVGTTIGTIDYQYGYIAVSDCETTACCIETMELCFNTTTQQLDITTSRSTSAVTCTGTPPIRPEHVGKVRNVSPCMPNCYLYPPED